MVRVVGESLPVNRATRPGKLRFSVATRTSTCRWQLEWRVTNTGVGLPFNISVKVTYNLDSNMPKVVRLDLERRKTF